MTIKIKPYFDSDDKVTESGIQREILRKMEKKFNYKKIYPQMPLGKMNKLCNCSCREIDFLEINFKLGKNKVNDRNKRCFYACRNTCLLGLWSLLNVYLWGNVDKLKINNKMLVFEEIKNKPDISLDQLTIKHFCHSTDRSARDKVELVFFINEAYDFKRQDFEIISKILIDLKNTKTYTCLTLDGPKIKEASILIDTNGCYVTPANETNVADIFSSKIIDFKQTSNEVLIDQPINSVENFNFLLSIYFFQLPRTRNDEESPRICQNFALFECHDNK